MHTCPGCSMPIGADGCTACAIAYPERLSERVYRTARFSTVLADLLCEDYAERYVEAPPLHGVAYLPV